MAADVSIRLALEARLLAFTWSPALPIAWENDDFTPPDGDWLQAQLFRSSTLRRTVGPELHERLGFLQVAVMSPKRLGAVPADTIAAAVQAHFPADLRLTDAGVEVEVTATPEIAGGLPDGSWWRVPVTVNWRSSIKT